MRLGVASMKYTDGKADIIKIIDEISRGYTRYEIFSDWVKSCALAMSNACTFIRDDVWTSREKEYMAIANKHGEKTMHRFCEMLGILTMIFEDEMSDVLGQIYMEGEMGSKQTGQFFTPYHISEMCTKIALSNVSEGGKYVLNEPSCGGGGMIIATAAALKDAGIDYQLIMEVIAQDLDWKGAYMCYLQLGLLGISATCIHGDTLSGQPVDRMHKLYTPRKVGLII